MEDHKPRRPAARGSLGSWLFGIFVGLLLGLLRAAGVAIYMMRTPLPFIGQKPKPPAPSPVAPVAKAEPAKPAAGAEKSSDGGKPRFEFYKILPGKEEPAPDRAAKPPPRELARAEPATLQASGPTYMVQAGSFQNPADADNMKAKLALIGLVANVEPTPLPDKGTWYRVRLGPYTSLGEINHVRSQLAQNGIDATLVKVKAD